MTHNVRQSLTMWLLASYAPVSARAHFICSASTSFAPLRQSINRRFMDSGLASSINVARAAHALAERYAYINIHSTQGTVPSPNFEPRAQRSEIYWFSKIFAVRTLGSEL